MMRLVRPSNSENIFIEISGKCDHKKIKEKKLDSPVKIKLQQYDNDDGPLLTPTQMQKKLKVSLCL
jgi:hypothetical protein